MESTIVNLGENNSYINPIMAEIRDAKIQQDRWRFRTNMERVAEIMAYEISKELAYTNQEVTTPLGTLEMPVLEEQPVIVSIMRAGLPFHQGFLRIFDKADNAFVAAYRKYHKGDDFDIKIEYISSPILENRNVIIVDPMIATGRSLYLAYQSLIADQTPKNVFVAGLIGSETGLQNLMRKTQLKRIYVAAIDKELTVKAYIVPGLGDAGDLAYGEKE